MTSQPEGTEGWPEGAGPPPRLQALVCRGLGRDRPPQRGPEPAGPDSEGLWPGLTLHPTPVGGRHLSRGPGTLKSHLLPRRTKDLRTRGYWSARSGNGTRDRSATPRSSVADRCATGRPMVTAAGLGVLGTPRTPKSFCSHRALSCRPRGCKVWPLPTPPAVKAQADRTPARRPRHPGREGPCAKCLSSAPPPGADPLAGQQPTTHPWPSASSSRSGTVFHRNFQSSVNKCANKNKKPSASAKGSVRHGPDPIRGLNFCKEGN